jgi:hypothetical protein
MKKVGTKICEYCGIDFIAKEPNWEYCEDCQENYEYAPCYAAEAKITEKRPEEISNFLKKLRWLFFW